MIVIRAGLGDDVNDAGTGSAHLGREPVRGNLELVNAIFGKVRQGAAYHLIIVIPAVDRDVTTAAESACR